MPKALIIDDELSTVASIKLILEKNGFEVEEAYDGEQGMRVFDKNKFDIVVTDILMPNKDGIKIIQYIRKKSKTFPILAISGGGAQPHLFDHLAIARLAGANETLRKPFETSAFVATVKACLEEQAS